MAPATTTKSASLRVSVTPELLAELERIAEQHDVSVAHVVRRAIRAYLTDQNSPFIRAYR